MTYHDFIGDATIESCIMRVIILNKECGNNTKDNGECKDGYEPDDCCKCAPGYIMNQDKECVPSEFCGMPAPT